MEQINGKVLVFTDLHLGLKSGSKTRLIICVNVIKQIISYIKKNEIKTCFFLGDWHHVRSSTENNVMNVSYKLMSALAKYCKVYCILGNHDIYMKNSSDINSLIMFNNIANVKIVNCTEEFSLNGNKSLFVPWLGDISKYQNNTFDMLFGHFDASTKFLIKSYIQKNIIKNSISSSTSNIIDNDQFLKTSKNNENIGDFVGDFVDIAKENSGTIFSGHIHLRKEFIAKGRKFIFVGDPYQQNLGEKDNICGFYVINENNSYEFHEIKSIPKHVEIRISEVINNIDSFDFSIVKNNILHKIYDIEIDNVSDSKISQKINNWQPYEELLPDYEIDLNNNQDIKIQNESIELIKKSKLDYIKTYINNIDKKILQEKNIDQDKLFNVLSEYYNSVASDEK